MSDYETRREDARREVAEDAAGGCRSGDPYCTRNKRHVRGTHEEYEGALCGSCEDDLAEDGRALATVPAGPEDDEDCHEDRADDARVGL